MRDADEAVYAHVLGNYASIYSEAKAEMEDVNKRFVLMAEAEAALMDSATFMPTTTQGGNYAMTRVAYHTIPYSMWGNDTDRLRNTVVTKNFITKEQRASLKAAWEKARSGEADSYDAKGILTAAGHEVNSVYATSFNTFPETLDILNTSMAADTEPLVNAIEGLIEYDALGQLRGRAAESWDNETQEDGTETWTFVIKEGLKWYNADGTVYEAQPNVTAQDFVDGFHHMLDAQAGLEFLTQGVIVNADEYINGKITDFSKVGVKAEDNKVIFTLIQPESFFATRLTYSCFMPLNKTFFESKGGVFGIENFKKESAKATYTYGLVTNRTNMVYNGPYTPTKMVDKDEIVYTYNTNYKLQY
jgi:ABC-type oligopeptide transport system substrate-binding subunit